MPRSRSDLITEALDNLGVTQAGQDPSAEDAQKVDGKIDGLLADLSGRTVLYVQDGNAIDDEYFDSIGILLANRCAVAFGGARDPGVDMREEAKLRELQRGPGDSAPIRAEYF